jgi:hypothetical protein
MRTPAQSSAQAVALVPDGRSRTHVYTATAPLESGQLSRLGQAAVVLSTRSRHPTHSLAAVGFPAWQVAGGCNFFGY